MKFFVPLLICCCLVAACNRPMPQPPVTRTPTILLLHATQTQPVVPQVQKSLAAQTTFPSQASSYSTLTPTTSPTSWPTSTPKTTSAPYPTPAWCPVKPDTTNVSGKLRVAYANRGSLWLWVEGRKPKQLNKNIDIQQVSLSDDGQIIAYTRQSDEYYAELWATNADGSHERRLVSAEEFTKLDASTDALGVLPTMLQWEPGTHHLTFFTYPLYDALWIYEPSIPWLVAADIGSISAAPYHGGHIVYAPDGKHVVIFSSDGLSLARLDGSSLRENILPGYHGIGEGESYYHPWPFWASDSSSLLVALPDQDEMYSNNATVTVWRVPVEGSPEALGQWKAFAPSVHFSPDLTYLTSWPWPEGTANQRELHLARIDGNTPNNIMDVVYMRGELIDNLAWSPDSRHFIFQMGDPGEQAQLYLGDICERPIPILENPSGGIATWVEASRFLLEIHPPTARDSWELRLGTLGQGQTEFLSVVTSYDWAIIP